MTDDLENTSPPDVKRARAAVAEARRNAARTDDVVSAAARELETTRAFRRENHFTERIRQIWRGATP